MKKVFMAFIMIAIVASIPVYAAFEMQPILKKKLADTRAAIKAKIEMLRPLLKGKMNSIKTTKTAFKVRK